MGIQDFARRARGPLVAIAMVVGAGTASAQQSSPESMAIAKELIELRGVSALYEPVVRTVVNQAQQVFLQLNPTISGDVNQVGQDLRREYEKRAVELGDTVAKLYAERFSTQEMRELLAFYKSKLGQKVITEEPKAMEQSMIAVRDWASKLSEEVLNRMREELRKKGHDL